MPIIEHKHPMIFLLFSILWFGFGSTANSHSTTNKDDADCYARHITHFISNDTIPNDSTICPEPLPWDERLRQGLDSLVATVHTEPFTLGFCVYDLTADSVFYGYNEHKSMRPASTQKLITAISALHYLGATHTYNTCAYYTGAIQDSVLRGDIHIVGDFDPIFDENDLNDMADVFTELGIKRIEGRILGDVSMKDSTIWGEGWCWDDAPSDNEPYLTPLLLNRGCVKVNASVREASTEPQTSYVSLNPLGPGKFKVTRNWISNGNIITTTGRGTRNISVFKPELYFLCTLCDRLTERGITITGAGDNTPPYDIAILPESGTKVVYRKTRNLSQLLNEMLKESDNLYAESMFYKMANAKAGRWATANDAREIIRNIIAQADSVAGSTQIADGSGVSLYNYTTPRTLVALLKLAHKDNNIFSHLFPSLPIAGMDGTLTSRMKEGNTYGNVHAKTGTLYGVSSLAGYVTATNGHLLAFSIISNGCIIRSIAKDLENKLCQELAR